MTTITITQTDTLVDAYRKLHDGLSDIIESGRLTEADCPEDFHWLVESLATLGAHPENNIKTGEAIPAFVAQSIEDLDNETDGDDEEDDDEDSVCAAGICTQACEPGSDYCLANQDYEDGDECDCDSRFWHGDVHDTTCPLAGQLRASRIA